MPIREKFDLKIMILSPIASGNGAYIIHKQLAHYINNYEIRPYNPLWTLFPPFLYSIGSPNDKTQLIHTTPDYSSFSYRRNIPLIITFHNYVLDSFMDEYSTIAQRIYYKTYLKYLTKKALNLSSSITSVSHFTASLVKQDLNYKGDIKVIYNGIDCDKFYPTSKSKQSTIKVLFSGNLTRRKGADLLPAIAKRLNKNIQIFYTSGLRTKNTLPETSQLKNIGSIPFSQMPNVYQEADILLFPTVREGFGLAAAEAMACGLPIVATNCSSLPELVIHDKGGYLCQPNNINEFAQRINELAESPKLRTVMGEFNRSRVEEKFTIKKMVDSYKKLFEQYNNK